MIPARLAITAAVMLGAAAGADAASLRGVVLDTECLVLPGVEVALHGDSTERHAVTGASGEFVFDDLSEPRYSLRARLQAFQTVSREDVLPSTVAAPLSLILPVSFDAITERVARDAGPSAPPRPAGFSIHVLDETCHPIGDATVAVTIGSWLSTVSTNAAGDAPLPDLGGDPYSLSVSAQGFSRSSLTAMTPPRQRTIITMPIFRGPPETVTLFEPSPPTRLTAVEPMIQPPIRIVAMGDSTTAGTPAFKSPREAPPNGEGDETSQYAYWLMKAHPGWEVVNQGVNAQRSDVIAARFDDDVIAKRPAVVVIVAGVNDVYQGRPAQHVTEQLAAMYRRARAAGIRVVAGTIIPYDTATPDQNARMHEINAWIRAQADAGLVTFVDTRAAVAAPGSPDVLVSSPDGLHPDAAGYHRMADAIALGIARALATR